MSDLPSVCLTVASFRFDNAVIALLESVLEGEPKDWDTKGGRECFRFNDIIIVDSMGTGNLARTIKQRGWSTLVEVFDQPTNIGSAGNLAMRLQLAADRGHDWVYAINHDGEVDLDVVEALVSCGESLDQVGAVYPLRYKTGRKMYDLTGTQKLPLPFKGTASKPSEELLNVYWGSSNGTLYALNPTREGLKPWSDLWMGWEDFGYGWLLEHNGYHQVVLTTVENRDPYEFVTHRFGGASFTVTDKASWYSYYMARNLILITRRNRQPATHWVTVAGRIALEVALTTALRPDKLNRYKLLARGTLDGILNRTGKIEVP